MPTGKISIYMFKDSTGVWKSAYGYMLCCQTIKPSPIQLYTGEFPQYHNDDHMNKVQIFQSFCSVYCSRLCHAARLLVVSEQPVRCQW